MSSSPPCSDRSLSCSELEDRLDDVLNPVLSSRRTAAGIAADLSTLPRHQQRFVLHWVEVVARSSAELGYQFAAHAPRALALMDEAGAEEWLIHAMDVYDKHGLYPASATLKDVGGYAQRLRDRDHGVEFEEVAQVLELFLCGLAGRKLKVAASDEIYTDTGTVFLPHQVALLPSRDQNFRVYKVTAAYLWAQTRHGTFSLPPDHYPGDQGSLQILNYLESVRLEANIARTLPGLARDMAALRHETSWDALQGHARLTRPGASVTDSLALLQQLDRDRHYPAWCYMGVLFPERAAAVRAGRLTQEKGAFRTALARFSEELNPERNADSVLSAKGAPPEVEIRVIRDDETRQPITVQVSVDGRPVAPPEDVIGLAESILQDLGDIPPDYLVPAGEGAYRSSRSPDDRVADVWKGVYHEEGAHLYNEWDYRRRHYRRDWCVLREMDVHPGSPVFVAQTLDKYTVQVLQLRRTFEALRGENRRLRKQPFGDEVDFDAVVESFADLRQGLELPERLFVCHHKAERNLAVMFMVDMSGSTKGWINDAEREALVMLCEALEVLGDRYAIYGFSGITRKRCEVYRVKRFDERYDELVKQRIAGIIPLDYTRMGVAIRHLTRLLAGVDARTKLLITLSDGKPDDYSDEYRGEYGVEDTRQALLEAKRSGIHPFCITIDREARDYLPRMYGDVNYAVVDDVARLPLKVADIYRRLTT